MNKNYIVLALLLSASVMAVEPEFAAKDKQMALAVRALGDSGIPSATVNKKAKAVKPAKKAGQVVPTKSEAAQAVNTTK